jgi:flavodoxin
MEISMTKFDKSQFTYDGMYLTYQGKFVARFKRGGKQEFLNFLVKNFSVDEYFAKLSGSTPIQVLETKGYVAPKVKKLLKIAGYPQTQAGFDAYLTQVFRPKIAQFAQ